MKEFMWVYMDVYTFVHMRTYVPLCVHVHMCEPFNKHTG